MARSTYTLTFWQRIAYGLLFGIAYTLSLLPLRVLYLLSDVLYLMVFHLVGYRRKLVQRHLADSFPEKEEAERKDIEKAFYRWFCDYIVETLKLFSMSRRQMRRRLPHGCGRGQIPQQPRVHPLRQVPGRLSP